MLDEMKRWRVRDMNGIRVFVERLAGAPRFTEKTRIADQFEALRSIAGMHQPREWTGEDGGNTGNVYQAFSAAKNIASQMQQIVDQRERSAQLPMAAKLYIPVLRSLRDISAADRTHDILADCTKRSYFAESKEIEIFTGQTLFDEIENLALGNLQQRQTLRAFEQWISDSFFGAQPVAIIPRKGAQVLTIKIGDEQERPIHELGDGIQSLLILAFRLFGRADDHLLVFMEEPEMFLHPWLQRVLLEVLSGDRFPRHQYFMTTHSNHFLDLTVDIDSVSVFTFEKKLAGEGGSERSARITVSNVSREDRRPLELLGVRNSSVFLSNCTIWVEGITDRRYLARWIDLYQAERAGGDGDEQRARFFKEDLHYSFVEYGGGNVVHWSFLDEEGPDVERLCGTLFLIADNDGAKPDSAKAKRHKTLQRVLQKRFQLLDVREIENLLAPHVIRAVLLSYGELEDNLRTVQQDDYSTTGLGSFIEAKMFIDPKKKARNADYAAASGTVNTKVEFSARALQHMNRWNDLSAPAQELTKRMYKFVAQHNSGAAF